ncbi:threonine aspartase 1-like isoform X3 [Ptychodera flava]|uniref:threonine aspartase 1-like isoform X3 n=1 Tax=Ptychodera flava TaxID=63121 RepID=UPI00396A1992
MICAASGKCMTEKNHGAGYHSPGKSEEYKRACYEACEKAMALIEECKSSLEAVTAAVAVLEDSPCTNAGIGSCLTLEGSVECDASVMDGKTFGYGAVGAVAGIKNPVKVAHCLLREETKGLMPLGRIPPCFLAGKGAYEWAIRHGIEETPPDGLVTQSSLSAYRKYKQRLQAFERREDSQAGCSIKKRKVEPAASDHTVSDKLLDTVGAICIDCHGNISSAVSSGGLAMKHPGRVGQAAVYGCGCWALNASASKPVSVACSTTGCGEYLLKTMLARRCAEAVLQSENATQSTSQVFKQDFIESPFLANVAQKHGGAIIVRCEENQAELVWAHTTDSMCIGYMSGGKGRPKTRISRLPESAIPGNSLALEGTVSNIS